MEKFYLVNFYFCGNHLVQIQCQLHVWLQATSLIGVTT